MTNPIRAAAPAPRIPAAKNIVGDEAIYYLLARPALRSMFHRVWCQTLGPLPRPANGPLIFYVNHSSWWDGYLSMLVLRAVFKRRFASYVMMEEKQLRNYRFFTWSGAFSINRRDPEDVDNAITYIATILNERRDRALYIFPQGRIIHNDVRPLVIYPGVARVARMVARPLLCPIVYRYEFRGEQRAEAFVRIGPPHRIDTAASEAAVVAELTQRMTASADALRDQVIAGATRNFSTLLRGSPSIDRMFDRYLALVRRATRPRRAG